MDRDLAAHLARLSGAQRARLLHRLEQRQPRPAAAAGEEWLVGYVVPNGGAASAHELCEALRDRLPRSMIPSAFVFLPALPRSPNGKVDRRALPDPSAGEAPAPVPPRTDLERMIAGIWRDVLGLQEVSVDHNFFDVGGHSLRLLQVQDRLATALSREVPIVDLFRFPTVATLARQLAESGAEPSLSAAQERARKQREVLGRARRPPRHGDG